MEGDPREQGQPFSVWSCQDLALHLLSKGFLRVSDETIRRHLQRLDYRIVRPVLSISSPDPGYEEKAAYLEVLKEQARQGQIVLLVRRRTGPEPLARGDRLLDQAWSTTQDRHPRAEQEELWLWCGGLAERRPGVPFRGTQEQ